MNKRNSMSSINTHKRKREKIRQSQELNLELQLTNQLIKLTKLGFRYAIFHCNDILLKKNVNNIKTTDFIFL